MKSGLFAVIICLLYSGADAQSGNQAATSSKKHVMKQFSLLVRVPETYSREQVQIANKQWEQLLEQWKASGIYVISFAFPGESYTVSGADKTVRKESVFSGNLRAVSNIVLQAENMDQALELAKSFPVLPFGGSVELREIPKPLVVNGN